ncbi:TlpA family protein disulfide reductase [Halobellus ordinarius]|uniref:TlpA family protein disulfide reductase n=1 Tax=Halobellus ordinarius TaxID=3075120 RepID=UPI0028802BB1|nr:TlpA disulfide reductase family protein [Halobellus sp. ZY16]
MPSSQRRSFLGTVSTAIGLSLAGCAGLQSSGADTPSKKTESPAETPTESDPLALPSVVTRDGFPDGDVVLKPDGKIVLLNFFTTWCRPCQEEMPAFRQLRAEYDSSKLHMVSITPEVDEMLIREFWREYEGTWPVVTDPALAATDRWNANSYPTNLVFERDGSPATGDSPTVRARTYEEFASIIDPLLTES